MGIDKIPIQCYNKENKAKEIKIMYIIHEENHDCLCVAETLGQGVLWLIKNDWLSWNTIGVDKNDLEFLLESKVKGNVKEDPYLILAHLINLSVYNGIDAAFEWLEQFGIYFNKIEVA
jgi:hypothetical protein